MAEGAAHGVEEHQVARLQVFLVDLFGAGGLFGRLARQQQAQRLLVDVAHKAAAVKTRFGAVAATAVGHTQETHGGGHQVCGAVCHHMGLVGHVVAQLGELAAQILVPLEGLLRLCGRGTGGRMGGGAEGKHQDVKPA